MMGTSSSSSGSPSNTPLVPPWVTELVPPSSDGQGDSDNTNPEGGDESNKTTQVITQPAPIAPAARFKGARTSLGSFARTGSADDLKKGVGHYIHKGLGGSSIALRRFEGTVQTAGSLYRMLSGAAQASDTKVASNPIFLTGRSADEVMSAITEAVRPVDGTQDSEASRASISQALSSLLTKYPDADLLNLSEGELLFAIENFIAIDVFNRFYLDLGKTIQGKAPSTSAALDRLKEVKDYIIQTVSAEFRNMTTDTTSLSSSEMNDIIREALGSAMDVFEEYCR